MTMLPVTLVLAAGCALINLWLAIRIGAVRRVAQVFVGDGGDERVIRRMRAQANFAENAPFVVALVWRSSSRRGHRVAVGGGARVPDRAHRARRSGWMAGARGG